MPLGMEVGLSTGDFVLGADPAPAQKGGIVYCGQTAPWITMPLGMEVGVGPDDIVLDGDPAFPPQKGGGAPSPIFSLCPMWPNSWVDQAAFGMEVSLGQATLC